MKRLIFFSLIAVWASMALAHDFYVDGIYYVKNSDGTSVSVSYEGKTYYQYSNEYSGAVNIPPSVTYSGKTYDVTSIGSFAFSGCSGLTSLTIPNSVTSIRNNAFYYCSRLTSVTIGNSVTSIGDNAFRSCSGLTSVTIPNSVTSIGSSAFEGTAWFNNQPNGLVYAGRVAYTYKGIMPSGTFISINDGTVSISPCCFQNCSGLTSVTIPNSVASIGNSAFSGCSGLTSVTIGNSVTSIGIEAFYNCSGLTSVTIGNSVTSIGEGAFRDCSGLTSVTIGNSVTSIGVLAFDGTAWFNNQPAGLVYAGKVAYKYKGTMPSNTSIAIKEGIVSISPSCFSGCSGLTSVTIPNSVTSIGESAFYNCSGLTSATIGNSVTEIGYRAFSGCTGLSYLRIPDLTTSIGSYAFYNCSNLVAVSIGSKVKSIGSNAFSKCEKMSATFITDLDAWCNISFASKDSNPLTVSHHLYYNGAELKDMNIPENTTKIGDYAFYGMTELNSVTIPDAISSIGTEAFSGCASMKVVNSYPDASSVTLGEDVFKDVNKIMCALHVVPDFYANYCGSPQWNEFMSIIPDLEAGVEGVEVDLATKEVEGYYDLKGIRLEEPIRGQVNIVRYTDGSSRKIVVK